MRFLSVGWVLLLQASVELCKHALRNLESLHKWIGSAFPEVGIPASDKSQAVIPNTSPSTNGAVQNYNGLQARAPPHGLPNNNNDTGTSLSRIQRDLVLGSPLTATCIGKDGSLLLVGHVLDTGTLRIHTRKR